jgi:hypothetical protein
MLPLDDERWKMLLGGYRIPYDASVPLRKLEQTTDPQEENAIWQELWEELHHQGDVGSASYAAVPHILRIVRQKKRLDWNPLGLVTIIELWRHTRKNPPIPDDFIQSYLTALNEVPEILAELPKEGWDELFTRSASALLSVSHGHLLLADAILELSPDLAKEFLHDRMGYEEEWLK